MPLTYPRGAFRDFRGSITGLRDTGYFGKKINGILRPDTPGQRAEYGINWGTNYITGYETGGALGI